MSACDYSLPVLPVVPKQSKGEYTSLAFRGYSESSRVYRGFCGVHSGLVTVEHTEFLHACPNAAFCNANNAFYSTDTTVRAIFRSRSLETSSLIDA